jgi:hypothetical protein
LKDVQLPGYAQPVENAVKKIAREAQTIGPLIDAAQGVLPGTPALPTTPEQATPAPAPTQVLPASMTPGVDANGQPLTS